MNIQRRYLNSVIAILSLSSLSVMADDLFTTRSGRIGCGGTFTATSQQSTWDIRNFSDTTTLTIDRMRFYDALGGLRFDSANSGLPVSLNGVLGVGDNKLEPNQTVTYNSDSLQQQGILVLGMPVPFQFVIDWSAPVKTAPLAGSLTRISYSVNNIIDPNTGNQVRRAELGRAIVLCRDLPVDR
jgi:hypothetical protein